MLRGAGLVWKYSDRCRTAKNIMRDRGDRLNARESIECGGDSGDMAVVIQSARGVLLEVIVIVKRVDKILGVGNRMTCW